MAEFTVSKSGGTDVSVEINYETGPSQSRKRCTQKVPELLRRDEHNKRHYDPVVVSFGPYHYGKPELKLVEDFKPKALEWFAGKDIDFYYNKALLVIDDLRRCYIEISKDKYDDAVFAKMMLHDTSFFINYIQMSVNNDKEMEAATTDHLGMLVFGHILRDMSLLENQIPLWFLKLLIRLKYGKDEGEEILIKFMSYVVFGRYEHISVESNKEQEEPLHFLEANRRIVISNIYKVDEPNGWSIFEWLSSQSSTIGKACQRHCLSKFQFLIWKRKRINRVFDVKEYVQSFRSVTDLKAKGIHFRPSPTDSLKDISFYSSYFYGKLQLPTWIVTKKTKVVFLNLVALEMYPNTDKDLTVSTYINFMKSLIESPKDVKELREKKIIYNMLGSDEEVLQVYKDINTYGVDDLGMFYEIREKIQEHYNSKAKTWAAELIHTYFRSPWTVIALLAANFLLCLALVQTYFTIHPSSE